MSTVLETTESILTFEGGKKIIYRTKKYTIIGKKKQKKSVGQKVTFNRKKIISGEIIGEIGSYYLLLKLEAKHQCYPPGVL